MLHLATSLFKDEEVTGTEECHAGGLIQPGDGSRHLQLRVDHGRSFRRRQRGRVHRQCAEESVLFIVDPGCEEQRTGRGARDAESEL